MTKNISFIVVLIALAGIAIAGAYLILSQSYPVALVDWKPIFAKDFNADYQAALIYYKNALEVYAKDSAILNADETKTEIKRAILDNLIENNLIEKKLRQEIGNDKFNEAVANKIEEAVKKGDIQKATETLYGFSLNEFKERVLAPQAKKEILKSLFKNDFEEKLKEIKKTAKIIMLLPDFEWNGEGVIIK
ncbi:MAG: SurA N-terminal domain-containing protein [Patescibacteria group bacterium]|mgnify:FL=1